MNRLLEHARDELKLAGYDIDTPVKDIESDDDYGNACAQNAYKMLEVFCSEEHSGFSAEITLQLFNRLAKWQNLTPLTSNPDEWIECDFGKKVYQSKRCSSCFSDDDLKTYYDVHDEKKTKHSLEINE